MGISAPAAPAARAPATARMHILATGAAFVDSTGAVRGADRGFLSTLGLPANDPGGALRASAADDPALRAFLAGEGPERLTLAGADGAEVVLERVPVDGGALLLTRAVRTIEWLEHALRSEGLTRLAAGLAHDIKNPLNAMALQLALLADKLSASPEASAASAGHLGALREQIGRVNEVVRRFLDVTDPSAPLGYTDLGVLVGDLASLFGHDARRRRIALEVDAPRGAVRTGCEAARVGRLVLSLFARALATTPEGGRLVIHVEAAPDGPTIWLRRSPGPDATAPAELEAEPMCAAAEALGGALELGRPGEAERVVLRLPRNQAP